MTSYEPEKRPNLDEILEDKWLKQFPKDKNEMEKLEENLKKELLKRESIIKEEKRKEKINGNNNESSLLVESNNRSSGNKSSNIFDYNLRPGFIDKESVSNNYIKTKGNLKTAKIMNDFYHNIKE